MNPKKVPLIFETPIDYSLLMIVMMLHKVRVKPRVLSLVLI